MRGVSRKVHAELMAVPGTIIRLDHQLGVSRVAGLAPESDLALEDGGTEEAGTRHIHICTRISTVVNCSTGGAASDITLVVRLFSVRNR